MLDFTLDSKVQAFTELCNNAMSKVVQFEKESDNISQQAVQKRGYMCILHSDSTSSYYAVLKIALIWEVFNVQSFGLLVFGM